MVLFPKSFKEVLAMHADKMRRQKATYLFESSWKRKYTERGIYKKLAKYVEKAGIQRKISPHHLRHFLLAWLKGQGIDNAFIQPYSGLASMQSLDVYKGISTHEAQKKYDEVIDQFPV